MTAISPPDDSLYAALTPREFDVMHYVAVGTPNKVIAAELGVSQRTIEAHRARIFQKMRVRNAVELARCVLQRPPESLSPPLSRHVPAHRSCKGQMILRS
ncbi:MAG: LuxR family transcriptional regulator [Burkholderiaceae bacterium]|nr:MAG: LuxR family transcriptional regulator [Burkholderiaceae bacterium]TAM01457.1 MAG: LuxR family transcriptional regulator [Pusillimonas sp.]